MQTMSQWEPPSGTDTVRLREYLAKTHSEPDVSSESGAVNSREGKIRVKHLLVKHKGSRRPSSWRDVSCCETQDTSMDE